MTSTIDSTVQTEPAAELSAVPEPGKLRLEVGHMAHGGHCRLATNGE